MTGLPHWPDLSASERMAIVTPLWLSGQSNSQIATRFTGATRNSVIGQIHRAKLVRARSQPKAKSTPKKSPRLPIAKAIEAKPARHAPPVPEHTNPDVPVAVDRMITTNRPPLAGVKPISILDLPYRSGTLCRFPVEGGYCGAASNDQVYCPTHHRICHVDTGKMHMPKEARL